MAAMNRLAAFSQDMYAMLVYRLQCVAESASCCCDLQMQPSANAQFAAILVGSCALQVQLCLLVSLAQQCRVCGAACLWSTRTACASTTTLHTMRSTMALYSANKKVGACDSHTDALTQILDFKRCCLDRSLTDHTRLHPHAFVKTGTDF